MCVREVRHVDEPSGCRHGDDRSAVTATDVSRGSVTSHASSALPQAVTTAALLVLCFVVAFDGDYVVLSIERVNLRPHHIAAAVAATGALAWLVTDWRSHVLRRSDHVVAAAIAVATVAFLSAAWGAELSAVVHQRTFDILIVFATAFAVAVTVRDGEDCRALLFTIGCGSILAAAVATLAYLTGSDVVLGDRYRGTVTLLGEKDRLTRPFSHANIAAMFFAPAAVGFVAAAAMTKKRTRAVLACLGAWLVCLVAPTASRAGLLAVGVGVAAIAVAIRHSFVLISAVVTSALLVAFAASPALQDRVVGSDRFEAHVSPPDDFTLSDTTTVSIDVHNKSGDIWPANGIDRVVLTARWRNFSQDHEWLTQVWPLPHDVASGERAEVNVQVRQQVPDGSYLVIWDLLVDREAFFLESHGSQAASRITVVGSKAARAGGPVVRARPVPDRRAIWGWSLELFAERPVFGHGPANMRFVVNDVAASDRPVSVSHAHNIVLEPLSAWGVVGGVPFLTLLALLGIDVVRRLRRFGIEGLVIGSAIVAVLTQGLLEWPLMFPPLAAGFGILAGLWARLPKGQIVSGVSA